ncbi:MAG: hypothetical protein LBS71_02140, partial [Puniceicoccales bacterium]|nr:hypothetical protein [Puniceicoccales bacterium]
MLNRKVIYSCGALLCTGHLLNAALTEKVLLSPTRSCKFAPPLVRHQDIPFAQFAIDFSTMSEGDSLKLQQQRQEILNIRNQRQKILNTRKQWQKILRKHNISLDQLDRLFPTLSFKLAAQLPEDIEELRTATQKAIQSSLKTAIPITAQEFYPCS